MKGPCLTFEEEREGWARINGWIWERNCLRNYKETRNGLLGADYSSKLSPWLAAGCLSAVQVYGKLKNTKSIEPPMKALTGCFLSSCGGSFPLRSSQTRSETVYASRNKGGKGSINDPASRGSSRMVSGKNRKLTGRCQHNGVDKEWMDEQPGDKLLLPIW